MIYCVDGKQPGEKPTQAISNHLMTWKNARSGNKQKKRNEQFAHSHEPLQKQTDTIAHSMYNFSELSRCVHVFFSLGL